MSRKIFQNIFKDKRGGTVLMLTILILSSILTVSLVSADIVMNSLKASRIQNYSTKAFFAAEAGAERALFEIRKEKIFDTVTCPDPSKFCFDDVDSFEGEIDECVAPADSCGNFDIQKLSNDAEYQINYDEDGQWTHIISSGVYVDTKRVVEISYCAPNCIAKNCGDTDGCGSECPPTCTTDIGCRAVQPANTDVAASGSCCTGTACYECANSYYWNGAACVAGDICGDGVTQTPNSVGVNELCDIDSPLGGDQECAEDCLAIGYGFYMANNTTININNSYFIATSSPLFSEQTVDVTCKAGRLIEIYGLCEDGNPVACKAGATGTAYCRIGCSSYSIPNDSYYQFLCR